MNVVFSEKIFDCSSIPLKLIAEWRSTRQKIVFTNGCFDLLHRGHIQYLNEASRLGDRLVVGMNSDKSVSGIKGKGRPIKNQVNRSEILAALQMVDLVVIFEDDTPKKIIEAIIPDILVKGGDWPVDEIVGGHFVIEKGGEVLSLDFIEGESSSSIIEKIKKS